MAHIDVFLADGGDTALHRTTDDVRMSVYGLTLLGTTPGFGASFRPWSQIREIFGSNEAIAELLAQESKPPTGSTS